ncbi:MAG: hypothetical protein OXB88_04060 [Bacteriovoracales bacterium]|nr:hypothetical protein [Bacteriovoracales bacterium]
MGRFCYWPILTFLISFEALAWKLLIIRSVSDAGRVFTTRTLKELDRLPGQEGTFTVDNASIVAETVEIGDFYTRWRLKDPLAKAPFERGLTVTFHPSPKAVWPLQKSFGPTLALLGKKPDDGAKMKGWQLRFHSGLGLTESVSGVSGAVEGTRNLLQGEFSRFQEIFRGFRWNMGMRLDIESNEVRDLIARSNRGYLIFGLGFYPGEGRFRLNELFPGKTLSPHVGLSLGLGYSSGQWGPFSQSGLSLVLPHIWAGFDLPLNPPWNLGFEIGLESVISHEKLPGGQKQKISQTNGKVGFSFRYSSDDG